MRKKDSFREKERVCEGVCIVQGRERECVYRGLSDARHTSFRESERKSERLCIA